MEIPIVIVSIISGGLAGAVVAHFCTKRRDRCARLRAFKAKMLSLRLRLATAPSDKMEEFYNTSRLETVEAFAAVREDITPKNCIRFQTALAGYCTAVQNNYARELNEFVHKLCPDATPLQLDQRNLQQRLSDVLDDLISCT